MKKRCYSDLGPIITSFSWTMFW